jgi:hypothetical protein
MSDLIKPTSEDIKHIKTYFRERYGVLLTDSEAKEIYLSLYYLGKALYRYNNLSKRVLND